MKEKKKDREFPFSIIPQVENYTTALRSTLLPWNPRKSFSASFASERSCLEIIEDSNGEM